MSNTTSTLHVNRQKEVAHLTLSAERVSQRITSRLTQATGPTLILSRDEYAEIGICISRLWGVAHDHHALLAAGAPTRDELLHISGHLATAIRALAPVTEATRILVERAVAAPKADEESTGGSTLA